MKKILFTLIVLSGAALSGFAQKSSGNINKFSGAVEIGVPLGNASSIYDVGLGLSLKYESAVTKQLAVTISGGYTAFFVKNNLVAQDPTIASTYGYIPVKAGLKYYVNENVFLEGQVGATFSTASGGGTALAWAPGIGYNLGSGFDMGIRYESWSHNGSLSQVGLRFAYSF